MLYFCSVDDIKLVLPADARYDTQFDRTRKAVTAEMNKYMRRTLHREVGVIEYFDGRATSAREMQTIWLGKRNVDAGSVVVHYSYYREWTDENVYTGAIVDAAKGKLLMAGPLSYGARLIRVQYTGGYPAIQAGGPLADTDVMDGPAELREACVAECSYRLDKLLDTQVNKSEDMPDAIGSAQNKKILGLLATTVMACQEYRKPLGTI